MHNLVSLEAYHSNSEQRQHDIESNNLFVRFVKYFFKELDLMHWVKVPKRLCLLSLHSKVFSPRAELLEQALWLFYWRSISFLKELEVLLKIFPSWHHGHRLLHLSLLWLSRPNYLCSRRASLRFAVRGCGRTVILRAALNAVVCFFAFRCRVVGILHSAPDTFWDYLHGLSTRAIILWTFFAL